MLVQRLTSETLSDLDLTSFVSQIVDIEGMSFSTTSSILQYIQNSVKSDSNIDFFVALEGNTILGCGAIKVHPEFPFYCLDSKKIKTLCNVLEMCSLYVVKEARGQHVGKSLFEFRLREIENYPHRQVLVEVRANYINNLPEVYATNKMCWKEDPSTSYSSTSLNKALSTERVSIHPNALSVVSAAVDNGFDFLGINAYDNGPIYLKILK